MTTPLPDDRRVAALLVLFHAGTDCAMKADLTYWRLEDHPRAGPYQKGLVELRKLYRYVAKVATTVEDAVQATKYVLRKGVHGYQDGQLNRVVGILEGKETYP